MKKILYILSAIACLTLSVSSCESLFDNLEGDLTKMTGEDMACTEAGIQMILAQVYSYIPMNAYGYEDQYTMNATDSHGGDYGFNSNPYYGMYGIQTFWNWSAIRTINSFIEIAGQAAEKGTVTEAAAKAYIAEARFVRAYCYFVMVRSLGGVPIITEPLDQYYDGVGNEQLFAAKYKTVLPDEEKLRAEIETQKTMFRLQQAEAHELPTSDTNISGSEE